MKKLFSISIFLLVVISLTSCKKPEEVTPSNATIQPNVSTTKKSFDLGVLTPDSTLYITEWYSTSVYTVLLSQAFPAYLNNDTKVKQIEFNKYQSNFYKIEYEQIPGDIRIKLYCDKNTYQANEHTVNCKILTDTTLYDIDIKLDLFQPLMYSTVKTLVNSSETNTFNITSTSGYKYDDLFNVTYIPTDKDFIFDLISNSMQGVTPVTGSSPTQSILANMTVDETTAISFMINKNKIVLYNLNTSEFKRYTITSIVNGHTYLSEGNTAAGYIDIQ